ncbi:MAG: phosphatase PAP2 family protein [Chitinivibrionales bacterium]|nr:phosphatase PAP2 family protein [Chitinivibrionales bacterium]
METTTDRRHTGPEIGRPLSAPLAIWPACICTVLLFLVFISRLDNVLFIGLHSLAGEPGGAYWAHVTILGDGLVAAVVLLPFVRRRPDILFALVVASLVGILVTHGIKPWLDTPRPPKVLAGSTLLDVLGPAHKSRSFPSGHAMTAFMIAGIVAMNVPKGWRLVCVLVATTVAVSRVVVGVHWPTDVLAGAACGWVAAVVGVAVAHRWRWGSSRPAAIVWGGILIAGGVVMVFVDHTGYTTAFRFQQILAIESLSWGIAEYVPLLRASRAKATHVVSP